MIVGKRFGGYLVLASVIGGYKCQCLNCGREVVRASSKIKRNKTGCNRCAKRYKKQIDARKLAPLLEKGLSLARIAAELKCAVGTVRYWMQVHNLKCTRLGNRRHAKVGCRECGGEKARSTQTYCSTACQNEHLFRANYQDWIDGGKWPRANPETLRRVVLRRDGAECSACGGTEWLGQPMPLEVDHIDGNGLNHLANNVRLLCHNCHALTPTFRVRNRGSGRKIRRMALTEAASLDM
jgi:hypothetical protein